MQGSIKIEAGEKKLEDVTTSMKKWKKVQRKYTERTGSREIDRGGEGNPGVENRSEKNRVRIAEGKKQKQKQKQNKNKKKQQKRETMYKTTLCYCTPNLYKLVVRRHSVDGTC